MPALHDSNHNRGMIELIFVTVLFLAFALSALVLVMLGGKVYGSLAQRMDGNYELRTPVSYVATKVRQSGGQGRVELADAAPDVPALVLRDLPVDGVGYSTWIYYYDGALRELYIEDDVPFSPGDGDMVLPVASFSIEDQGGLLRVSATGQNGQPSELYVAY